MLYLYSTGRSPDPYAYFCMCCTNTTTCTVVSEYWSSNQEKPELWCTSNRRLYNTGSTTVEYRVLVLVYHHIYKRNSLARRCVWFLHKSMQIRIGSAHPPSIIPCEVPPEIRLSNLSRPVHLVAALLFLPTGIAGMVNDDGADEVQGSWTPFVIVTILFLLRFILYGENSSAIVCRWWCNMQVRWNMFLCAVLRYIFSSDLFDTLDDAW